MTNPSLQAVVDLASRTGVGQWASQLCPECTGGGSRERSLSLNVEAGGMVRYHCHRAACGFSGTVYSRPDAIPAQGQGVAAKTALRPYTGDLHALSDREVAWFQERFNLPTDIITENIKRAEHRYALPIWSPQHEIRGWITRRPWEGSPADTKDARADAQASSKVLTYMETDDPVMSWYGSFSTDKFTGYVVEDPISAMRLASFLEDSVSVISILGTGVNIGKIAELQRHIRYLTIALDHDATGQAFAMARKWGQGFYMFRVCVLDKDLKDSTDDEIKKLSL